MDNYCLKLVQHKYKAWKRYSFSRNHTDYLDYCQLRNKVTRSVHFAKKRFERGISLEAKENSKSFWKFVKSDLINKNGDWISDDYEKANELNDFFGSVFTKAENDSIPEFQPDIGSSVCDITVTIQK